MRWFGASLRRATPKGQDPSSSAQHRIKDPSYIGPSLRSGHTSAPTGQGRPAAWLVGGKPRNWENRCMEPRWGDPEAPWWAKLRRAKSHISEVRQQVHVLQVAEPWSVQREPAGPDGWAYRFRVHKPVPADLAAATGDAVANMRAALD